MKMKDIITEKEINNTAECEICKTHERAYNIIEDGITCPYCNALNYYKIDNNYIVVGEENCYSSDHDINKFLSFKCHECSEDIILIPNKVIYNANHDIYYTGGKAYLNDDDCNNIFNDIEIRLKITIEGYTERIKQGEKLESFYPALWCRREIESAIAEYLYKKGLKK